ncbi:integral membrane protein dgcr2/idd [Holotrichia oblita]|uniref:Integral membrane protein dgcr2/idd n=1 Tax=Holotrichia oblita TaxID=644536 RepID=A0ACB9SFV0_HOLOL|nr:integral membrane protein dgcr2/idd [Holotrichia oblita]
MFIQQRGKTAGVEAPYLKLQLSFENPKLRRSNADSGGKTAGVEAPYLTLSRPDGTVQCTKPLQRHQQVVSQGLHYIPGTNPCTLCVCDKGGPKWCKSVLCAPPQNCKSFQVGTLCCEFKCLDDILTVHDDTYDVALRFIASAVTAILSLSLLFFLFHRLKRRKVLVHQNQQLSDDQRSLNSIGYIAGSLGYLPESIGYLGSGNTHDIEFHYEESSSQYSLWKPPGNYFPRGEAPPPYEEAVRAAQLENNILNSQIRLANSLTNALNVPGHEAPHDNNNVQGNGSCRHDFTIASGNSNENTNASNSNNTVQYANVIVQDITVHSANDTSTKQRAAHNNTHHKVRSHANVTHKNENINHERAYENIPLSTKSSNIKKERATTSSNGYKNQKTDMHEYTNVDKPTIKISRYDVIVESNKIENNIRKNDKTRENYIDSNTNKPGTGAASNSMRHPQVPEQYNVHLLKGSHSGESSHSTQPTAHELRKYKFAERNVRTLNKQSNSKEMPLHRTLPKNLRELLANAEQMMNEASKTDENLIRRSHASAYDILLTNCSTSKSQSNLPESRNEVVDETFNDIALLPPAPPNFASPNCETSNQNNEDEEQLSLISYQCLSSSQDEDDYRSECENCKSSGFTIPNDEETDVLNETMTLQRRPLETGEEVPYYRTSLTLPTNTRKSRAVATNSNRENWFTSMQETSNSRIPLVRASSEPIVEWRPKRTPANGRTAHRASQQGSSVGGQGTGPNSDPRTSRDATSPRPGPARQPVPASRPSPTRPDPQSQSLSRSYGSNLPTSLTYIILSTRGSSPWRPAADMGGPKWCKSVLCAPPQNCKSFQVGTLCCEFKCLDDILTVHDDTYDVALRFIASAVTAILSLSLLFFLFHRLKRRKVLVHQNQQLSDDQRSLNSIGYIAGSLGYLPESIGYLGSGNTHDIEFHYEESSSQYSLWKPPGNYFPRGEAPPPYEEAVRAAQLENNILNSQIRLANSLTNALNVPGHEAPHDNNNVQGNGSCRHDFTIASGNSNENTNASNSNNTVQYANVIVQDITVHSANDTSTKQRAAHNNTHHKVRSHANVTHKNENINHERAYENIPLSTKSSNIKKERATTSSNGYKNQKTDMHEYTNVDKPTIKISRYDVIVESNKIENNIRKNDKTRENYIDSNTNKPGTGAASNSMRHPKYLSSTTFTY